MMNEKSVLKQKIDERLKEKKEMDGFVAGGMRVHGMSKQEYNLFATRLRAIAGDDPFWNAFLCPAK